MGRGRIRQLGHGASSEAPCLCGDVRPFELYQRSFVTPRCTSALLVRSTCTGVFPHSFGASGANFQSGRKMDPFDEWVKTQSQPCLLQWADLLINLGASWDSFRRDADAVVNDLVAGGIPILAARDIVNIASETIRKSQAPMAIFWDLENLSIPAKCSGREVVRKLKAILAPHGNLIQFRGYASIGEGNIPQQKRSDLQLSGCHLVDCPHVGRKEVVDKMIIVDAMHFAFTHPDAATICLITGDVDYAYLLAVLQQPQWRTVVISKGTIRSMLHVNCDMKMRWETDILQMGVDSSSSQSLESETDLQSEGNGSPNFLSGNEEDEHANEAAIGYQESFQSEQAQEELYGRHGEVAESEPSVIADGESLVVPREVIESKPSLGVEEKLSIPREKKLASDPSISDGDSLVAPGIGVDSGPALASEVEPSNIPRPVSDPSVLADNESSASPGNIRESQGSGFVQGEAIAPPNQARLTQEERSNDDVEIFRRMMWRAPVRKSFIGDALRQTYPTRFHNRQEVKRLLAEMIKTNVVKESGDGPFRELTMIEDYNMAAKLRPQAENERLAPNQRKVVSLEALSKDEKWTDDVELLRMIIQGADIDGSSRKADVGNCLRQTNPARFHNRKEVKDFLAKAIERGVVKETGSGAFKKLTMAKDSSSSKALDGNPSSLAELAPGVIALIPCRPYTLFVPWSQCSTIISFPEKAYVYASKKYILLMFRTLTDAERAIQAFPALQPGHVVDLRKLAATSRSSSTPPPTSSSHGIKSTDEETICKQCKSPKTSNENGDFCNICTLAMSAEWIEEKRKLAIRRVVEVMMMLAENDDVDVHRSNLQNLLKRRWPKDCLTADHALLWIRAAADDGKIRQFGHPEPRHVCLASLHIMVITGFKPGEDMDTSKEEKYIEDLLWDNNGAIDKKTVIASLSDAFPHMNTPFVRNRVILNAARKKRFFYGKGAYGQVILLNLEDAPLALAKLTEDGPMTKTLPLPTVPPSLEDSDFYSDSDSDSSSES